MGRHIYVPENAAGFEGVFGVERGGSGVTSAEAALAVFSGIPANKINAPGGVLGLDETGQLPLDVLVTVGVDGPVGAVSGIESAWYITTYDILSQYVVQGVAGTARIEDNIVYYTPDGSSALGGFILNGRRVHVQILDAGEGGGGSVAIATPSIAAPVSGASNLPVNFTFASSNFTTNSGTDAHYASDWQLSTTVDFTQIEKSVTNSTSNLTTWSVTGMVRERQYFVRMRMRGVSGSISPWSPYSTFMTQAIDLPTSEIQKILAGDGNEGDQFGYRVAMNAAGTLAAVSAHLKEITPSSGSGYQPGAVYIYELQGGRWSLIQRLMNSSSALLTQFGDALSMSADGSTLAVGVSFDSVVGAGRGSVHLYQFSGLAFGLAQVLTASDASNEDRYGTSVSLSQDGSVLAVGAPYRDDRGSNSGKVYMYRKSGDTWVEEIRLTAFDGAAGDLFGTSVAVSASGLYVAGGAPSHGIPGNRPGAVYVFFFNSATWVQESKLAADDGVNEDKFGYSLAINAAGETIAVSAIQKDGLGVADTGAVYIYTRTSQVWTQRLRLLPNDLTAGAQFGHGLAMNGSGTLIAAGAPGLLANAQGAIYLFTGSGAAWVQSAKLNGADAKTDDRLGNAVALSSVGSEMLASAYTNTDKGAGAGAAYFFAGSGISQEIPDPDLPVVLTHTHTNTEAVYSEPDNAAFSLNTYIPIYVSNDGTMMIFQRRTPTVLQWQIWIKSEGVWINSQNLSHYGVNLMGTTKPSFDDAGEYMVSCFQPYTPAQSYTLNIYKRNGSTWSQYQSFNVSGNSAGLYPVISGDGLTISISSGGAQTAGNVTPIYRRSSRNGNFQLAGTMSIAGSDFYPVRQLNYDGRVALLGTNLISGMPNGAWRVANLYQGVSYILQPIIPTLAQYPMAASSDGRKCLMDSSGELVVYISDVGIHTHTFTGSDYVYEGMTPRHELSSVGFGLDFALSRDGKVLAVIDRVLHGVRYYKRIVGGWSYAGSVTGANTGTDFANRVVLSANGQKALFYNQAASQYGTISLFE